MSPSGTGTSTTTNTVTSSRVSIIVEQLAFLGKMATGSADLDRVLRRGLAKQWLDRVWLYGLNRDGNRVEQIIVAIDWNRHSINVESMGSVEVGASQAPGSWFSGAVGTIAEGFSRIRDDLKLTTDWAVGIRDGINADMVRKDLGLSPGELPPWASEPEEAVDHRQSDLDEVRLRWFVALPE